MAFVSSLATLINQFGLAAVTGGGAGGEATASGITATGGVISDYTDGATVYRAHIFTSLGTFSVSEVTGTGEIEYLLVAGGGGGANPSQGQNRIAGSGAGGFVTGPTTVSATSYPIFIGAGGAGNGPTSNNGANTTAFSQTAYGGGGAGRDDPAPPSNGFPGGSGGGGWYTVGGSGGTGYNYPGPTQQGYPGSPGFNSPEYGGGGGGAGGAGQRRFGGAGAPNVYAYGPTNPVTYAAGGESSDFPGTDRTANGTSSTGNGGSGRGSGGSGIVVVRYALPASTGTAKATGGAISYYGGKTIHVFTSTGPFVAPPSFNETVEYFIVGSGAGGGNYGGGGGGAGGIRNGTTPLTGPISYTVTIGAGGRGTISEGDNGGEGLPGNPSSFGPIGVGGGGGGGSYVPPRGGVAGPASGGSGGGAGSDGGGSWSGGGTSGSPFPGTYPYPVSPSTGWGHPGGNQPFYPGSGGGGGAGSAGSGPPAVGGSGIQAPSTFKDANASYGHLAPGAPQPGGFYFGGGGNGWRNVAPVPTTNPYGGGGYFLPGGGTSGLENTGGGGAGGNGPGTTSGSGGSGIVLIAYPS